MANVARPLAEWTEADLQLLVGRLENQFLEAKGADTEVDKPDGRRQVARAVAGLASAMGGLVVVGAAEEQHVIQSLPGVSTDAEPDRRLLLALSDLLIPFRHLRVRAFAAPDADASDQRVVLVIQVPADPGGRPVMVRGRGFYVRTEDNTVPMPYLDIERRMSFAQDRAGRARSEAEALVHRVRLSGASSEDDPLTVVSTPVHSTDDLGRTGEDLKHLWWDVAEVAERTWEEVDQLLARRLARIPEPVTTGHGLVGEDETVRYEVDHRGRAVAAFPTEGLKDHHFPDFPSPFLVSARIAHVTGVFLSFQRRLGLFGPTLVRLGSGGIAGTSTTSTAEKSSVKTDIPVQNEASGREIVLEGQVPLGGETELASEKVLVTFLTRLADHSQRPFQPPAFREERDFLRLMLPPFD